MEELPTLDEIGRMSGPDLDAALRAAEQLRRRAEAVIAAVVGRANESVRYLDDGHRSVKGWAMAVTNCSPAESRQRRQGARVLGLMPEVRAAFRAGTVGVAQFHLLAKLAANPRARVHLPASDHVLLDAARSLPYPDFELVVDRWLALADPDGARQRAERVSAERTASLTHHDGVFEWHTKHGVIQGTIMSEVFEAFVHAEFLADWEACVAEHGEAACPVLMRRTARQRRADALVAIFGAAAIAGIDGQPIPVNLNLIMDEDQYEQQLANALDGTPTDVDPSTVRIRRCETVQGVTVDPRTVVALSVLAHVRRIVVNSAGVVVNAGQRRRLFDRTLADILKAVEPRCTWLGCMIRAAVAQIDHLQSFTAGGPTSTANAAVMCEHHNLFKYRTGYQPRRRPDGTWQITRPDGTVMTLPDAPAA